MAFMASICTILLLLSIMIISPASIHAHVRTAVSSPSIFEDDKYYSVPPGLSLVQLSSARGNHGKENVDKHNVLQIHNGKAETKRHIPDVVITGIGESGTRGVKQLLQHLGITFCDEVNDAEDNLNTMPSHEYIIDLLKAAEGHTSDLSGYLSEPLVMNGAVHAELEGAEKTWACAMKDNTLPHKWGYKNPRHFYLMPVMDVAFHGKQNMLAVARDPRDLCTGEKVKRKQNQFKAFHRHVTLPEGLPEFADAAFRGLVALPKNLQELHHILNISISDEEEIVRMQEVSKKQGTHQKCMEFWAYIWASVLQSYAGSHNLRIVRIEDLVVHHPITSHKSHDVLDSVLQFINISASTISMQKELGKMHEYRNSYMGHHHGMTNGERKTLEREVATYTGIVHEIMVGLGYHTEHYGLVKPTHPLVFSP